MSMWMISASSRPAVVSVSRYSSVLGATAWFLGIPIVAWAGVIPSGSSYYFWEGVVTTLVGSAMFPVTLAYPGFRETTTNLVARIFGAVTSVSLIVTGALLIGGSLGPLGQRASDLITTGNAVALIGLYVWILLATLSRRTSVGADRPVYWLGLLAPATFLLPVAVSAVQFFFFPKAMDTNATLPLVAAAALFIWLGLPAWLLAFATHAVPATDLVRDGR